MAGRAMYTGSEAILQAFDGMNNPYYSLWSSKDLLMQNPETDVDAGRAKLAELLAAAEQSNNSDILTLKFHPKPDKGGYITDKTAVIGTLFIRVVPVSQAGYEGMADKERIPYPMYKAMQAMEQMPQLISTRLSAFEERLLAVETGAAIDADEEPEPDLIGRINGIASNPAIMGLIEKFAPLVMGFLSKLTPMQPIMQTTPPNMAVSGVNEPTVITADQMVILNNSLDRLANHCDIITDLKLLADLAEKNPQMFKMLLNNLRSS